MALPTEKAAPVITEIENFKVVVPWPQEEIEAGMLNRCDMVRIRTDAGISGYATGRAMSGRSGEGQGYVRRQDAVRPRTTSSSAPR